SGSVSLTPPGAAPFPAGGSKIYYTPNSGFTGTDTFTYQVSDGFIQSGTATVTVNVSPPNNPPTATTDNYTTDEDTPLVLDAPGILVNDTDPEGQPLSVETMNNNLMQLGSITLSANGALVYRPRENMTGVERVTYRITDGTNYVTGQINITVGQVNDAPLAFEVSSAPPVDTSRTITLRFWDDSSNGTTSIVSQPQHGTLGPITASAATTYKTVTYTPAAGYTGPDNFTWKYNDGELDSNVAIVNINVGTGGGAQYASPYAVSDNYTTTSGVALTVAAPGVLTNDSSQIPASARVATKPAFGTLALNKDGSFVYTPRAGFTGSDTFTYRPYNSYNDGSTATVTITVNPAS
ncbi:MAG TPA: Ig-like domain-containing protein, partial [Abditibacteriaceae bacterium]